MRAPNTILLLALASVVPLSQRSVPAQVDSSPPLTVTTHFVYGLDSDCKSPEGLVVDFHYTGAKPLRGYLVTFTLNDTKTGKPFAGQIIQEIRNTRKPMINTGATWTRTVCSIPKKISGDASTFTSKVDVLKFADGSIWGPAALSEFHKLIGTLDGMDFITKTTDLQRFVSPILPQNGPKPVGTLESQTIGPLKFDSGVWRDERGQDKLTVEITNQGSAPIRGYLFTITFFDPSTGAHIRSVSTKELETHGNPDEFLVPGSTWVADPRKFSYLPDGALASYKIDLDLVVFADGSTFGPIYSQESNEVLGMFAGIDSVKGLNHEALSTHNH